jgi:hypothetical protein
VRLVSGDVLCAELVFESADAVVLKHPPFGQITLARLCVSSVTAPPPPQATESKGAQAPAEVAVVAADVSLGNAGSSAAAGEAAAKADAATGQKAADAPKREELQFDRDGSVAELGAAAVGLEWSGLPLLYCVSC